MKISFIRLLKINRDCHCPSVPDDEIALEMIEEMVVELERSEDEKVEEDKYEDESGDE